MIPANPAQVAGGQGPGQDGDAFGGADSAEHPAAVGVLGVALEQRDQAGQGQRARYAHDDHPDDGRPDRDVAQRVQEDGQVHQAEADRADAEQARRPRPVARGRGDHAAGDSPDRLRGHHQPELLAAPVQHVLDERREQRAHDALADAGDQGEDHQGPQHPVSARKTQARAQLRADATEPEPDCPDLLAGRIRPGRAPARADQGEQGRGDDEAGGVGERHGGEAPGRHEDAADRRARQPGRVRDLAVERVGRQELLIGHQPGHHGLLGGGEELLEGALGEHHHEDDPDLPRAAHQQQRQQPGREQQVGHDHGPLAVPPVGEHAGHRAE